MPFDRLNDPYSGNIFGRIGKGIGQGLSEQLPKEIERGRLASGIENISKEGANISPMQQIAQLLRSGADINQVGPLSQLIRENQQRQSFLQGGSTQGARKSLDNQPQRNVKGSQKGPEGTQKEELALSPEHEIEEYRQSLLQEPTREDIQGLAREYLGSGMALNRADAMQMARDELTQNLASQRGKSAALEADLNKRVAMGLQNAGIGSESSYKDVAGKIQQRLIDEGKYLVNSKGLTPEAASAQIEDIIYDLGIAKNSLSEAGSMAGIFGNNAEKIETARSIKDKFDRIGFGDIFNDMASSAMGITPQYAGELFDPIEDKQLRKEISSGKVDLISHKMNQESMDRIVSSIKPGDNILSVEKLLRDRQVNMEQFKKTVRKMQKEKKIHLDKEQERQLQKPVSNTHWGDLLFDAFRGKS